MRGGAVMRGLGCMVLALGCASGVAHGEDFPAELVRWVADPPRPIFSGADEASWDFRIRERGWIWVEDGLYHLFYTGYNEARSPDRLLGHATSTDGIIWRRDPANPIHGMGWVEDMSIIKDGATYVMFAEGRGDIAHRLTSTDLIHWSERGPLDIRKVDGTPISPGPYGTPTVIRKGDLWHLFYERGDRGVWLATSPDMKVWTNVQDNPVLSMGPEPYDRTAVALNQVIERDGVYYAYYHANANQPWRDWTTCVARSRDLVHWEKYPGNPIVRRDRSSGVLVTGPEGTHLYTMHPQVWRFSNPRTVGAGMP